MKKYKTSKYHNKYTAKSKFYKTTNKNNNVSQNYKINWKTRLILQHNSNKNNQVLSF